MNGIGALASRRTMCAVSPRQNYQTALIVCFLFSFFAASIVCAHNGSVAISSVVKNIEIDGKFGDWPEDVPWQSIGLNLYGDPESSDTDCVAEFRVGVDPVAMQLYVAVRVSDDSVIPKPTEGFSNWKTNDAAPIYLGMPKLSDNESITGTRSFSVLEHVIFYDPDGRAYSSECRFDLREANLEDLKSPFTVSFTAACIDKDNDGSFTTYFWSPEVDKAVSPNRRGDLIVCRADRGTVTGEMDDAESANLIGAILLDFEAVGNPLLKFRLRTNPGGNYTIQLPPGEYRRTGINVAPSKIRVEKNTTTIDQIDYRIPTSELVLLADHELPLRVTPGYDPILSKASGNAYFEMTKLNGLPDSRIRSISQDSEGALWLATESNLARFDGTRIRVYDESLASDVHAIWADEEHGRLWIAGTQQVGFIKDNQLTRFPLLKDRQANCIGPTHDERILIGTVSGLFLFDGETFEYHSQDQGLPNHLVTAVAADSKRGVTWIGTDQGLASFDGQSYQILNHNDGLADPRITSLFVDSQGILWVGTASSLYRYDGEFRLVRKHAEERIRYARSFTEMPDGTILVGNYEGTLRIPADYPVNDCELNVESIPCDAVFLDRDSQLWLGFEDGELRRQDQGLKKAYSSKNVHCSHLCSVGDHLWFLQVAPKKASKSWKAVKFDKASRHKVRGYPFPHKEDSDFAVTTFLATPNGAWAGTREHGVFQLIDGVWKQLELPAKSFTEVSSLYEDSRGRVWIATLRELYLLENDNISVQKIPGRPQSADILHVTESTNGFVAAATEEGIFVFEADSLVARYDESNILISNIVRGMVYDKDGVLWVTTFFGLQRIGEDGSRVFKSDDGLLDDKPGWFVQDWDDEFWCGSDAGVNRIAKRSGLVQYLLGKDGLGQCKISSVVADGESMWLAGEQGVWEYRRGSHRPRLAFDDIVTDESLGARDKIEITTDLKKVQFNFHAISLKDRQSGVIYEYRLADLDDAWKRTNETQATIDVPTAGTYRFEVRATDRDLFTSDTHSVEIKVSPPYGRLATQWGLIAACAGCVAFGMLYFARTRNEKQALARRVEERTAQLSDMERQLQQAQKMEALGTLASGVAHDFNNSLLAINGNAELALMSDSVAEKNELVSEVLSVTEQAADLTKSMLMFGGKTSSKKLVMDIRKSVLDAARMLRRTLPASIEFNCRVPGTPIYCEADLSQVQQVVLNLALNARDAMPHGGKLEIEVWESNGSAQLHVRDNGHGMSLETQDRIFEPFYTEKPRGKGTGLGLSVVHAIVEDHNGDVRVKSSVGESTEFTVTLPTKTTERVGETTQPTALIESRGRILIADDETTVLKMLAQALRQAGFDVDTCDNGLDFVRKFSADYDLVILDVDMPGKNGWDSLCEVRETNKHIAAIMISGLPNQSTQADERTTFIRKPFSLHEFTDTASTLLAR